MIVAHPSAVMGAHERQFTEAVAARGGDVPEALLVWGLAHAKGLDVLADAHQHWRGCQWTPGGLRYPSHQEMDRGSAVVLRIGGVEGVPCSLPGGEPDVPV